MIFGLFCQDWKKPGTETKLGTGPVAVEAVDKSPSTPKQLKNPNLGPLSIRHLAKTGSLEFADLQGTGRYEIAEKKFCF